MSDQETQGTETAPINASTHVDFEHSKSHHADALIPATTDTATEPGKPKQHRLSVADQALAIRWSAEGMSQYEIARRLSVTQSAISLMLKKYEPTVEAAKALIHAKAGKVARQWLKAVPKAAQRGDHRPARDWLVAAGAINNQPEQAQQVVIQIGNGSSESSPGLPDILAKVSTHES